MSEWEKLWNPDEKMHSTIYIWTNTLLSENSGVVDWLKEVKAEGDLNLKEKRSLLTYAKMLREENAKLDTIRKLFDRFKIQLTDECYNAFMEVLGDE